ncbi:class I SAM-dependent methyltransferase [Winogradskyella aurantia]|uniref:Methyltransferase type 11 n=1 Tax=Winogradskyella aurantia TaxID=1915063 RepID=A0A265UX22_9FLAO|nr:class I SAM-dependent methyltransferase [Winogradskyella aurantia]OZV69851.1 methyltransferase type 11 [Winogradskyella aurantia]
MNKGYLSNVLRRVKLFYLADWIRFYLKKILNYPKNSRFKRNYPEVVLPPDYLMYESFQLDYDKYFNGGYKNAKWIVGYLKKYITLQDLNILDWGCGPGRVIRHMPKIINNGCRFYGTDYNEKSINWCKSHLTKIDFNKNSLKAQLPYENNVMDIIYGISIFTHLSDEMHHDWFKELHRILKPGGIMFLTTHGDNFKVKLDKAELKQYNQGQVVVRGEVKEGHRTYCAFQPKTFMHNLFANVDILEHDELISESKNWVPQDVWIIRKPSLLK